MVKRLNIPLDDADFERAAQVKDGLDMTWEEFVIEAAECLADSDDD